jgi:hypothetical protein
VLFRSRPKLSPAEIRALQARAGDWLEQIRPYATKARFTFRANIDQLRTWDTDVNVCYLVRGVEARIAVENGRVTGSYAAGLNGGLLSTRFHVTFDEQAPMVRIDKTVRDVIARENIQPQLARFFPGNTVEGLFHQTADLTVSLRDLVANSVDPRCPLHPVGTSRTVTIEGVTRGRAAPQAVTRVFPGLNLAEYRYKMMTSFGDHFPDGSATNDMVFRGKSYDLYMTGKTDAENIGTYEVGLILVGTPQSAEWNHRWQVGRLPILKVKARIEGGQLHDEEVSYPWPTDTLSILYNPIYQAWIHSRKTTSDKPPAPPGGEEEK